MPSKQDKVLEFYEKHPESSIEQLATHADCSERTVYRALSKVRKEPSDTKQSPTTTNVKSPSHSHSSTNDFIDDPVELLTDVCIRKLNAPDPDSRWASILLQLLDKTNNLEFKDRSEAQLRSQLKNKSISDLISSKKKLIEL